MNENPEGTPNPLSQNPGPVAEPAPVAPAPAEPVAEVPAPEVEAPVEPVSPAPVTTPISEIKRPVRPVVQRAVPVSEPVGEITTVDDIQEQINSIVEERPLDSEEPKGSVVESGKKNKKPAMVIAIVLFLVAIFAGSAAAIVALNPFGIGKKDAVPAAIEKLLKDEAPKVVSTEGTVKLAMNYDAEDLDSTATTFTEMNLNFSASSDSKTGENYVDATVSTKLTDGSDFDFAASEMKTASGDLYLKLSGVNDALTNFYNQNSNLTNCEGAADGTNCVDTVYETTVDCADSEDDDCVEVGVVMPEIDDSLFEFLGVFEVFDNEWIKMPSGASSSITDIAQVSGMTQCLVDAPSKLAEYGKDLAKLYHDNQFVTYSTDNLAISKKKDTLYRLGFDADKLAGFINSMGNSGFMNELLACMGGTAVNTSVSASDLSEILAALPEIYVEIDKDNNFTRVFLSMGSDNGLMKVTADLALSYPESIDVVEPAEYLEGNQVIVKLLQMMGQDVDIDIYDTVIDDTEEDTTDDETDTEDGEGEETEEIIIEKNEDTEEEDAE